MLCSNCSGHIRPVVAIDIDGTLGDYHGSLFDFAQKFLGTTFHHLAEFDGTQEISDFLGLTKEEYRVMKLAYRQGGQKRMMPVFTGVYNLMWEMAKLEVEIWITTTRPWQRFDSTDPDTRHWLDRNKIPWDHLLFDDDKYKVLCDVVDPARVVGVLDDLAHNYDRAEELGLPVLLAKTQYNRAVHREFEVANLFVATDVLVEKVEAWQKK